MISIVILKPNQQPIQLMFRTRDHADVVYRKLVASDRGENDFEIEVGDDFGSVALINRDDVTILMQDLKQAKEAEGEIALITARQQAITNRAAQNDPQLKFLGNGAMGGPLQAGFRPA